MTTKLKHPFRLKPTFAARIWGRESLAPWYESSGLSEKAGEAWLSGPKSLIETGELTGKTLDEVLPEFPLLVKMLFPDDKLSVQVHPDDEQARALGLARGKTECWYVLEAEPGATVACGLKQGTDAEGLLVAIAADRAEDVLEMLPVKAGDLVFVDAGTVHAIGPGVTLLEVQQTCDVTYRLYDYGRPRELHLEKGLAVVKTETQAGLIEPRDFALFTRLIYSKYFVIDRYELAAGGSATFENVSAGCVVGLAGEGMIEGVAVKPGQGVVVPLGKSAVESQDGVTFVWCWEPA